ncbi:SP_1767 family glycosyltransferase [Limosilactobacillus reuteri]|uniref:SP_1767 family glycosyltransferase n=1 Tax=Limosilactobacillus reuteri TaxID=1598 RepID=UPI001E522CA0|nr:SP_1767 family glycosyltransferase [Limosilactobacillus reuteri]MCC4396534.1 SP_1767 family glycosyltransferase [Limosilactobacillus reuteri]MCC4409594.1 SP_1767 family glycosyltransferase [Limosilactobacillus reuteri]
MIKVIALSGDYGYLNQIETTIKSIMDHNRDVKIYVINPDIPHEWFVNLNRYLHQINSCVIDAKVDPDRLKNMHSSFAHINSSIFGRFLIPEVVQEDKVLYLDSDLIVTSNLNDLFKTDFEGKFLLAVRDYKQITLFNAGVMLINNRKWKENQVTDSLIKMSENHKLLNNDQTVINEFFQGQIGELKLTYNYQIGFEKEAFWSNLNQTLEYLDEVTNPKIIHYVTADKPFNVVSTSNLRDEWWHYRNLEWSEIISKYGNFNQSKIKDLSFEGDALIFTRVAETENLEELVQKLPNVRFNIAAYTGMAFLLLKLTQYDNVRLFPTIIGKTLDKEINEADVYLDINYGPNANEVVERIVQKNIPIFSFDQTKSPDLNYDNYHVFHDDQISEMASAISDTVKCKTTPKPEFNIEVKDNNESLDLILENRKSVVRFGDGEFNLIRGDSIPYQNYEPELAKRLKKIILRGNFNNTLVCLPDVFKGLNRYNHYAEDFYKSSFFPKNDHFLKEIAQTNNWYGSTFISRPYIDLVDKSKSTATFTKLKQIWQGRDLLIVEGALTRSGVGNDLFADAKSIKRILCPAKDSYQQINQIELAIRANAENRLILLMLGPTAKVIVDDLQDLSNQMIDIGHIDSEYEWFKMGATYKVKLENKHTAEFNFDEDISAVHDQAYQDGIVARIIGEE